METLYYQQESYKVIGACITVFNKLGTGFLILNTKYRADFICFNKIIVEIKALDKLLPVHEAQAINYLKATGYKLGLLINFGEESLKFKRLIRHNKSIKLDDKLPPIR